MKFSIVTPSYNQGQFIGQTIESVLSQKGDFEIEYFVMDGGSSDSTIEVLKKCDKEIASGKYSKFNKDIKFYWQSKKDKGQSDAINKGMHRATGDIVAYINSDDVYLKGTFNKVLGGFKKNPSKDWLTGYCRIVDEKGKIIQKAISNYKNFWLRHHRVHNLFVLDYISQPATFWKKELMDEIGLFDEKLNFTMDYDYSLRVIQKHKLIVIKDYLCNFRIHSSSKGKLDYINQFEEDFEVCKKYTDNKTLIFLHKFHNFLIKTAYRIIK